MLRRVADNLRLFLWALALALAVWVAAVTSSDPNELRVYPTSISVQIVGQDSGLILTGSVPHQVQITLRAPRSVWDQLSARPDSVRAVLDLSGLGQGKYQLKPQIQTDERPVQVVQVSPDSIALTLEPLVTKTFPLNVELAGQPAVGYQVGSPTLDVDQAVLSGAQSLVSRVTHVSASVNLDGARQGISSSVAVTAYDETGQVVNGISVRPESVHVSLPVSQESGFRDMAVKVVVHGQVANGYRLDNISVFPPVVTVYSSDPTLVSSLPGAVETQPLNLQNMNNNINTKLGLNLPAGVSVIGDPNVAIQADISAIESSLTLSNEKVEVTNLAPDLSAQVSPPTVDVIISGPLPLLNTLTHQDVRILVDVTGLSEGAHQLTPNAQILVSNLQVETILPGTVEVTLSPNPTPTVTP
ncbi:MAG TPA: CdaR family protein [Anaerolineales bacterium]|nr:CdaR family protein [Anaerolineales bacterium]